MWRWRQTLNVQRPTFNVQRRRRFSYSYSSSYSYSKCQKDRVRVRGRGRARDAYSAPITLGKRSTAISTVTVIIEKTVDQNTAAAAKCRSALNSCAISAVFTAVGNEALRIRIAAISPRNPNGETSAHASSGPPSRRKISAQLSRL